MLETKKWQAKNVNILATSLNFQQNYFDDLKQNSFQICIFKKILDLSVETSFLCTFLLNPPEFQLMKPDFFPVHVSEE